MNPDRDESTRLMEPLLLAARFPTCEPDLSYTFPDAQAHHTMHFFIGQNVTVGNEGRAFFGHTVNTSQVASIGHGQTQVVDHPVER